MVGSTVAALGAGVILGAGAAVISSSDVANRIGVYVCMYVCR